MLMTLIDVEQLECSDTVAAPELSTRKKLRRLCQLKSVLPNNVVDSTHLFIKCYDKIGTDELLKQQLQCMEIPGGMLSDRQLKYRKKKILHALKGNMQEQTYCFRYWLDQIIAHPMIEAAMNAAEIDIPTNFMPEAFRLARVAKEEAKKLLSCDSTAPQGHRAVATQLVINVAKAACLSSEKYGDISLLATTVSCSRAFAKKVLEAIEDRKENTLFSKNTRCDSILATEWSSALE